MSQIRNTVATPLLRQTHILHQQIFNFVFPCPLEFIIEKGKIRILSEKILTRKYMPFLTALIFFKGIVGIGSCVFILVIQIFRPMESFSLVALILSLFLTSCGSFECGVYLIYVCSREIVPALNQLFAVERTCKS